MGKAVRGLRRCVILMFCLCGMVFAAEGAGGAELWQVSTLQALMNGYYDGAVSIGEVKKHGDYGLGTFNKLDGEMIVIGGNVYKASVDGKVTEMPDRATTPFCNVAKSPAVDSEGGEVYSLKFSAREKALDPLKEILLKDITNRNAPCLVVFSGEFPEVTVRSVPAQEKPYRKLAVVAKEQKVYTRKNVKGTIVGFWFPEYFKGINATGFHLHFISNDRTFGGHMLGLGAGEYDLLGFTTVLQQFKVILPTDPAFATVGTDTNKQEIEAVEGK